MPKFKYKARDQAGTAVYGYAEADDIAVLKSGLRERGLWLIEAKPEQQISFKNYDLGQSSIKPLELIMFSKQMAVMLNSGVTLVNALEQLQDGVSPRFRTVLQKVTEEIKNGKTYSEALSFFPKIFSPFFIGMIEVGEAGGLLPDMHRKLVSHLEQNQDLKKKILFASIYPGLVLSTTLIGIVVILVYAFPKIADIYNKHHVELPFLTRMMIGLSDFIIHFWYLPLFILVLLLVLFGGFRIHQKEPLKSWFDRLILKLPFYGEFYRQIALARFTHNLSLLLNSGLTLLKSLMIVKSLLTNVLIQSYVSRITVSVQEGEGMASYLKQNPFFPSLLVSMARTGEESGEMVKMMSEASIFYESQVEDGVKKFVALVEPLLIIIAAGSVFLVLLAFYLPMFKMFRIMQNQ